MFLPRFLLLLSALATLPAGAGTGRASCRAPQFLSFDVRPN